MNCLRMPLVASATAACLFSSVSCVALPGGLPTPGLKGKREVVYTGSDSPIPLKADIYHPDAEGKHPAVLLIHGDGRIGDDGRWQMGGIARKLAERGYYVFSITYRMAPDWTYPAPLTDARQAVDWMRAHAETEGIDPDRIAAFGYSAGGYVALLAAMHGDLGIKAVVGGAAPSDLTYYGHGDLMRRFLGGSVEEIPGLYDEASPVNHVNSHSPPVFLYHGEKDTLVNPGHSREMLVELEKYKVPHEMRWIPGKGHISAFLMPDGAVDDAIDFLDRYMK